MAPWISCSLEADILAVLENDSPASVQYLCCLLFPWLSWRAAQEHAAQTVRVHCQLLARDHLLKEVGADTFAVIHMGSA